MKPYEQIDNDQYILNQPDERRLETVIADYLADSPLYNVRMPSHFDSTRVCDPEMLQRCIENGQPEAW